MNALRLRQNKWNLERDSAVECANLRSPPLPSLLQPEVFEKTLKLVFDPLRD